MKTMLFVVTHKFVPTLNKGRNFIGVGENRNINNVKFYDNSGVNISSRNKNYCELTALYWMWKNCKCDVLGLEHYRRYLCDKICIFKPRVISIKKITKVLKKYDAILPEKNKFKPNIYEHYKKEHFISDMNICKDIILEKYPDYCQAFDKVMSDDKCSMYNIFIMKKEFVDCYCEWLFNILFECEKRINILDRDDYQKRVFGFLSERLFNVWVTKNQLKVYYAPVYQSGDVPIVIKIKTILKKIIVK